MFPPKPCTVWLAALRFFLNTRGLCNKEREVKQQMIRVAPRDAFTCQCATQVSVRQFSSRQFSRIQYSTYSSVQKLYYHSTIPLPLPPPLLLGVQRRSDRWRWRAVSFPLLVRNVWNRSKKFLQPHARDVYRRKWSENIYRSTFWRFAQNCGRYISRWISEQRVPIVVSADFFWWRTRSNRFWSRRLSFPRPHTLCRIKETWKQGPWWWRP